MPPAVHQEIMWADGYEKKIWWCFKKYAVIKFWQSNRKC
jgi:hypothetical protein